ncbi:copper amine oxidase N-terminal domain-containing protein [Caldanaerobacter sp.]|uniref:copper amine oxidase N-terminal domain-containing protein n=1 Tax=Caldanaerobacter sp. TaxID=2930036 RepID=UPI003C729018
MEWTGQTVTIKAYITFPKFYTLPQRTLKRTLVFKIGSPEFKVDGQTKTMDTVPVLVNDRTMLLARFVAENLGYEVLWNDQRLDVTFVPKIEGRITQYADYRYLASLVFPVFDSNPRFESSPVWKDYSTFPDDVKILNSIFGVPVFHPGSNETYRISKILVSDCKNTAFNNIRLWYSVIDEPKDYYYYGCWYHVMIYHGESQPLLPDYPESHRLLLIILTIM